MDSKYTAIGVSNGFKKINNLKRKKKAIDHSNAKKLKLSNNQALNVVQAGTNGAATIEPNVKDSDLLETRKQLPVYMVKGRYIRKMYC